MFDSLDTGNTIWPGGVVDEDPEPEKVRAPTRIHNNPWGVVSQEYGKFHPNVKAAVRWVALVITAVVAITFMINYGSAQIKGTICHWSPKKYFCGP